MLANFSERPQTIPSHIKQSRLANAQGWHDLITQTSGVAEDVTLQPYQYVWLVAQAEKAPKSRKKAKA